MTFTNVDIGFTDRRYSFDGLDFGPSGLDEAVEPSGLDRSHVCETCGSRDEGAPCVACADLAEVASASIMITVEELLDSLEGRVEDEPDTEDEDEDEDDEDDDTEAEKAWVSSPGIRF